MNSRERVRAIVAGEPADRCGFWLGAPVTETWPILHAYFGTSSEEALRRLLGDDFRHIGPQYRAGVYRHPAGREMFDLEGFLTSHGQPGPLAGCTDIRALDEYEWPNPDHLHFFDEFILPWLHQFTAQAHRHGYQVIYHSCGAVYPLIGRLIAAGVDCLHPLQARAHNMNAETLSRDFRERIAFMGGIDTQELLVRGTPEEVKADVRRVRALLGPRLIVSPSHESVLPDLPPVNIQAMAEAALETL